MDDPDRTFQWLVRDEILYHFAISIMVQQLHLAVQEKKVSLVIAYTQELKSIGDEVGDALEKAQIRLECARAIFKLGNPNEAIDELNHAIFLLKPGAEEIKDYKHYYAVALWMLGSLLKRSTSQRKEAIVAWQNSLDAFRALKDYTGIYSRENVWYEDQCSVMCEAIENIVKEITLRNSRVRSQSAKTTKQQEYTISTLYSGGLKYLDVIGMIPAGGFGASGLDPYSIERIPLDSVMDEFIISGNKYKLYNIRKNDRVITQMSNEKYFILKVVGDSMNKAFIDTGDFVLMHEQNNADNGSIVAAEIINEDSQATLKRFTKINGNIVLQPQSTNETHKSFRFDESEQSFYIRGVVIGIFKPDL